MGKIPEWLPDWKDDSAYRKTTTIQKTDKSSEDNSWVTPRRYWAWQFLRRNKEFQSAYENISSILKTEGLDRHIKSSGIPLIWKEFTQDIRAVFYSICGDFGLDHFIPNPSAAFRYVPHAIWRTDFSTIAPPKDLMGKSGIISPVHIAPGDVLYRFNVDLPLDRQIKKAKQFLKNYIEVNTLHESHALKYREDSFPQFLRILDARAQNVTFDKIAEIIYPTTLNEYPDFAGRNNAQKAHKEAVYLVRGGYKFLID
jgi:hypothetical protein